MKIPEAFRDLARAAREADWTIHLTGGGHLAWCPPSGPVVFTPSTPSEWRGIRNARARLTRAGLRTGGKMKPGRGTP